MCGICGVVGAAGEPPARGPVEEMAARLRHRGPDEGSVDAFGPCLLGHQRLAVLDPEHGSQPALSEDGSIAAILNGELYNFRELRAELESLGHRVRGSGDTALLPHLYEEHGPGFVERIEGMFAVALWDTSRRRLVLARDRLGKKPLVWTELPDGSLAFGSELKALTALPELRREADLAALDAYLALGYVPAPRTAFRGVRKLPPAHLLVHEGGHVRVERYWELRPAELDAAGEEEWLERVRDEVRAAVRRRLVADVPLGALLSGGIDSSVVVACMAQEAPEPVRTFSIGFAESRYDERRYARAVAERWGTRHEELLVEPDAAALLPVLAWSYDEPFGDSSALPTYLVSELARRDVTVALTGDGGDETFAGYERYVAHAAAGRVPRVPAGAGARLLRALPAARSEQRSPLFRAARFLEAAAAPAAERYARLMRLFPLELRERLWTDDARAELGALPGEATLLGAPPLEGITGLQLLDATTYLPGDLLVKADIASMACSLELRSPLLDRRVVELGLALPDALKARGRTGKVALRRAFASELPAEVVGRAKKGFGVPLGRWFREELRDPARELLLDGRLRARGQLREATVEELLREHESGRADHGQRLWALLMLEQWQRLYLESERPPAAAPAIPAVA